MDNRLKGRTERPMRWFSEPPNDSLSGPGEIVPSSDKRLPAGVTSYTETNPPAGQLYGFVIHLVIFNIMLRF
jgi:hypothetical protein